MEIMTHQKYFFLLLVSILFTAITGCHLPMNTSSKDQPIQERTAEWLNESEQVKQNIASGLTAYLSLQDPFMSMAARVHLIQNAKAHLDLQYYIWEDDVIGHHLLSDLLKAADRGVKVRLLIDDQNGTKLDQTLAQLAQHPNFEIKLFNPYKYRHLRVIDYVFRFKNINHRMHNKLIIADGAVAVTGGRNISSEYFDASDHFQFADMDIFFGGKSVEQANHAFLQFWNDDLSYSVQQLLKHEFKSAKQNAGLEQIRKRYADARDFPKSAVDIKIQQAQKQIQTNLEQSPVQWAKANFLADSPDKIRGKVSEDQLLFNQIMQIMGQPKNHIELVSAYFVPTQKGADYLNSLQQQNIKARVLTNSFLANDVPLVHAFYQKYRKTLLQHGVKLYEFKPYIEREHRTWYEVMSGNVIPAKGKNSSRLHAKFFDIDGTVFIGSFNFDPRSAHLNTEVGLVVQSDQLQNEISTLLDTLLPQVAYELNLNEQGQIIWLDHQKNGLVKTHDKEPETTGFQRFVIKLVSIFPIEWMM
ncbi:phospholipase D family protein [Acinetobacter shaoyimingii]|uniref:Phospholipase D family protein n=1 Tax=Acinetobacter shaoyimingii TaxID=2715164 RepID=A0A6G8RVG7_9GAMM|nr:phospholipase D family protein [Acinetobacter shaoyimingii]